MLKLLQLKTEYAKNILAKSMVAKKMLLKTEYAKNILAKSMVAKKSAAKNVFSPLFHSLKAF